MRAWQIENDDGIDALNLANVEIRDPGPNEVRFKVKASSLNRRDYNTVRAPSARNTPLPRIPNSDAAGEVIAVGTNVTEFKTGDRVASCFFKHWEGGRMRAETMQTALGGAQEGMLSEETILPQTGLVSIPEHLSWEEASTLTVAGFGGHIGMIGSLLLGDVNVHPLLRKSIRLSGIFAGSREMFRDMNNAISVNKMRPIVDRVFSFTDARAAYHALGKDKHFGKLVIKLDS